MADTISVAHSSQEAPLLTLNDASYVVSGYRSFEFVSFTVHAGEIAAAYALDRAPVRDVLLAAAGLVRLTRGSVVWGSDDARSSRRTSFFLHHAPVGMGVLSGVADFDEHLTVEEVLRHEESAYGLRGMDEEATLRHLAAFGIATHADRPIENLEPAARARLSAALAAVGAPAVSVVDLTDVFCCGLTALDAKALIVDLRSFAQAHKTCFFLGTCDADVYRAADVCVALDMALDALTTPLPLQEVC